MSISQLRIFKRSMRSIFHNLEMISNHLTESHLVVFHWFLSAAGAPVKGTCLTSLIRFRSTWTDAVLGLQDLGQSLTSLDCTSLVIMLWRHLGQSLTSLDCTNLVIMLW